MLGLLSTVSTFTGNGCLLQHVNFHAIGSDPPRPAGAAAPLALCSLGQRRQLCPFLIAIELFYHPNNFASDVRNVINESELIVVGRHW